MLVETYCNDHDLELCKPHNTTRISFADVFDVRESTDKASEDFETLYDYLKVKCMSNYRVKNKNKKSMFKAFKNKLTLNDKTFKGNTKENSNKVIVVNGLPECLKVYSVKKFEMLQQFNDLIEKFLESNSHNLLVFIFSNNRERNKNFLTKIFNNSVLNKSDDVVKILSLNPITDKNIMKALRDVVRDCGMKITEEKLDEIVKGANKDINNALQTLQLYSANKMGHEGSQLNHNSKRKYVQSQNLGNYGYIDEESFFEGMDEPKSNGNSKKQEKIPKGQKQTDEYNKDYGLSIFHALGKFLYNKRINPNTGKEEIMSAKQMSEIKPRPKSYINHAEIMNKVETENSTFSLFLLENMSNFFGDIEDMAKVLEVYSYNDAILNRGSYSFANQKYTNELVEQAALTEGLAITEYNLHGGDINRGRNLKKMAKPEWFDFRRKIADTKTVINDAMKADQLLQKELFSVDFLTGTTRRIATEYLPYLKQMGVLYHKKFLQPLVEITEFSRSNYRNNGKQVDEAELDNDEKDQELLKELSKKKRQRERYLKKQETKDGLASYTELPVEETKFKEESIEDSDEDLSDHEIDKALEELSDGDISIDSADLQDAIADVEDELKT